MVAIIERREEAGQAPYVEFRVHADSAAGTAAVGSWQYREHAGPRAALKAWEHETGSPVDEVFRDAIRFAVEHGIPFVWVNDPGRLFPSEKRPPLP